MLNHLAFNWLICPFILPYASYLIFGLYWLNIDMIWFFIVLLCFGWCGVLKVHFVWVKSLTFYLVNLAGPICLLVRLRKGKTNVWVFCFVFLFCFFFVLFVSFCKGLAEFSSMSVIWELITCDELWYHKKGLWAHFSCVQWTPALLQNALNSPCLEDVL